MKLENLVRNKSTFSNVLKLMTGTVIAQGIGILIMPVLARLYNPAAFGILAVYVSIATILGTVACGRYELAIMLPKEDREAANLFWLSTAITLATSTLIFLAVVFTGEAIGCLLKTPGIVLFLWLVPFSVLGIGSYLSLNYWSSRKKMFGRLSISRVIQSSSNQSTKLAAGVITSGNAGGLVAGKVLSDIVTSLVLAFQVFRDDKHVLKQSLNWEGIKEAARRYRKFPLFDSWSTLLNTVSRNLPPFLLVYFFGPAVVGFFALGYRMISLPMGVLGHAVAQVYFQKASEAKREGNLAQVTKTTFRWLVILGLFPVFALMIVGPELFSVIFGQEWRDAGAYASILSPWLFFSFVSSPLSTIFSVLEKQKELFFFNAILLFSRLTALLLGGMTGNPFWAMAFMGGSGAVIYLWLCLWNLKNVGVYYIDSINILSRYFFMSIPAIALLSFVKYIQFNDYFVIAILPLSALSFFAMLYKFDYEMISSFLSRAR